MLLAATQKSDQPGRAPALGLRAGSNAFFIVYQAKHKKMGPPNHSPQPTYELSPPGVYRGLLHEADSSSAFIVPVMTGDGSGVITSDT